MANLLDRLRNRNAPPPSTNNTTGSASKQTVVSWFASPIPSYTPLSDVSFGAPQHVIPPGPPIGPMVFPNPQANKMLNLPSIQSIYGNTTPQF